MSRQAFIQLCNADVHKESLRHDVLRVGQFAYKIVVAEEGKRSLELVKNEFANYLTVGKLMAAGWAQSQGCDFDFPTMDLDSLESFDRAVEKVTADLKMLEELPADAKNFNSFLEDFPLLAIPEKSKDHVKSFLSDEDLFVIPNLSKRAMKEYSTLNFDNELLLPRGVSAISS